jgi:hypothetical protein
MAHKQMLFRSAAREKILRGVGGCRARSVGPEIQMCFVVNGGCIHRTASGKTDSLARRRERSGMRFLCTGNRF